MAGAECVNSTCRCLTGVAVRTGVLCGRHWLSRTITSANGYLELIVQDTIRCQSSLVQGTIRCQSSFVFAFRARLKVFDHQNVRLLTFFEEERRPFYGTRNPYLFEKERHPFYGTRNH